MVHHVGENFLGATASRRRCAVKGLRVADADGVTPSLPGAVQNAGEEWLHSHSSSNNKPIIITIIHTWKSFFQLLYIIKTPATPIWFTPAAKNLWERWRLAVVAASKGLRDADADGGTQSLPAEGEAKWLNSASDITNCELLIAN